MTGTLTVDGASATLMLRPQNTATVSLIVAGGQTFTGKVGLYVSRAGDAWEPARDVDGTALEYTGDHTGTVVDVVVKNKNPGKRYYRFQALGITGDPIAYSMLEVDGDVIEVILRDNIGRPVLEILDNGSLQLHAGMTLVADAVVADVDAGSTVDGQAIADVVDVVADVTISAADIVSTTAGKLGHAQGQILVAAPAADHYLELVEAVAFYNFNTHAYGGGGNISINWGAGGAALTGIVAKTVIIGAAADGVVLFKPLTTAGVTLLPATSINMVVATGAFTTDTGSVGTVRVRIRYRIHTGGLA